MADQINVGGEDRALATECDVASEEGVRCSIKQTVDRFGMLHIRVNNEEILVDRLRRVPLRELLTTDQTARANVYFAC